MANLLEDPSYQKLVTDIRKELDSLTFKIKQFIGRQSSESYWRVGRYIALHIRDNKDNYGKREELCLALSRDTGLDDSTLRRAAQYYEQYPKCAPGHILDWSKIKMILPLEVNLRNKLIEAASKGKWTKAKLNEEITKRKSDSTITIESIPKLPDSRGQLNLAQVIKDEVTGELVLDLGFKIYLTKEKIDLKGFKENQVVEVEGKTFTASTRTTQEMFTYKAELKHVADGDTLVVNILVGFGIKREERIRLASLNCPEMDTKDGERAKSFVESQLKIGQILLIKTFKQKVDKYDRYLANVYYSNNSNDPQTILTQGRFLNQTLLNDGLAVAI